MRKRKPDDLADLTQENVPLSDHFEVFECESCPNAHIVLFDDKDEPFAQMTVGPQQLATINAACEHVFAVSGIRKKMESKN
jgi:hypothetical protein